MKGRFSTIDIRATVKELQQFLSLRVVNVYDIDNKTYLIKLSKPDTKAVILIESAVRMHSTDFDWPKNPAPSGFSMKLRKHVKGRRLEKIEQLGVDRIVDLQFGSGEAAYHVIVELYDRGNIVLTDSQFVILTILRPRTDDSQDVRFAVREVYPVDSAKQHTTPTRQLLEEALLAAKEGDVLKRVLMTSLAFGPALIEHCLKSVGLNDIMKVTPEFTQSPEMEVLVQAVAEGERIFQELSTADPKGIIIQKSEKRAQTKDSEADELLTYHEYHPYLFLQHEHSQYIQLGSFSQAVDEFYSKMESQKLDMKILQQEKSAMKKLENVKKDHQKRIDDLQKEQDLDIRKGELIEMNRALVDNAITVVRSAIANQIDWAEIKRIVDEAQIQGDEVARSIKDLRLDTNHITVALRDPYEAIIDEDGTRTKVKLVKVDIDLGLGAYANSRRYFDKKKMAAKKEQKTIESSSKALKSAEKKTQQTLKDAATAATINKARKTFWFEKYLWFVSSENYLVVSGRDQQQNEIIVKRYLNAGDVYVHADLHGAASVIVKNHAGGEIPPKTLNEAGTMAICHSAAWDAKVVTSAWYVHHDQVSKTAPTGEYLTTGSFMIRGKKNYLPPSYLVYGFALLFKLEEGSVSRHIGERRVRTLDDDASVSVSELNSELESIDEVEIVASGDDSDDSCVVEADAELADAECADTERADAECGDNNHKNTVDAKVVSEYAEMEVSTDSTSHSDEKYTSCDSGSALDGANKESEGPDEQLDTLTISGDEESSKTEKVSNKLDSQKPDDMDKGDTEFPDTSIDLQHVKGSKFCLQRATSTSSTVSDTHTDTLQEEQTLDTDQKVTMRLSAKQRREMKKTNKGDGEIETIVRVEKTSQKVKVTKEPSQPAPKRGQRAKQKKIKEKYADEDEEERQLRMKILASAGAKKEKKKSKAVSKQHYQNVKKVGQYRGGEGMVLHDESLPVLTSNENVELDDDDEDKPDDEKQPDNMATLNTLTGLPHIDDELLFAVPVCAPYQALNNYKYKVKLLPGSTKRGKATKLAMAMFQRDRAASSREKDLMKILKDVDSARNIPGKVKVTAPNLQKQKR